MAQPSGEMMKEFKYVLLNPEAKGPERAYASIGFDCFAYGNHTISPGETKIIPLGFKAALEPGYGAFVWDRGSIGSSGIHTFHQLVQMIDELNIVPFAGVIDPDYRGQWGVVLHNFTPKIFNVNHRFKITQFVILKCETPTPMQVDELSETERGAKALGSSDQGTTAAVAQAAIGNGGRVIEANAGTGDDFKIKQTLK